MSDHHVPSLYRRGGSRPTLPSLLGLCQGERVHPSQPVTNLPTQHCPAINTRLRTKTLGNAVAVYLTFTINLHTNIASGETFSLGNFYSIIFHIFSICLLPRHFFLLCDYIVGAKGRSTRSRVVSSLSEGQFKVFFSFSFCFFFFHFTFLASSFSVIFLLFF